MSPNARSRSPLRPPVGARWCALSARRRRPGRVRRRQQRLERRAPSIVVSHGYTDVEATAIKAQVATWNTGASRREGQAASSTAATTARCRRRSPASPRATTPTSPTSTARRPPSWSRQPKLVDLTDKVKAPAVELGRLLPLRARRPRRSTARSSASRPWSTTSAWSTTRSCSPQAGVAPPTDDWTWQDFRDAAKKLTDAGTKTYGWAYVNDGSEDTVWRYLAMLWQAGGDLLNADNTKPAFDSAGRAGGAAAAARHGGHRQVGLPRHGQRQLPEPVQQRQDRDAVDRARGTCRASTPTSTTA